MKRFIPLIGILLLVGCNQRFGLLIKKERAMVCKPVIGSVAPSEARDLRWRWADGPNPEYNQLMATPMVGDMNGDGTSDFVFVAYKGSRYIDPGVLRVVSGIDGHELWSSDLTADVKPWSNSMMALYDLDGDGHPEILVNAFKTSTLMNGLAIYSSTGSLLGFSGLSSQASTTFQAPIEVMDLKRSGQLYVRALNVLYPLQVQSFTLDAAYQGSVLAVMELDPASEGQEILINSNGAVQMLAADRSILRTFASQGSGLGYVSGTTSIAFGSFGGNGKVNVVVKRDSPLSIAIFDPSTGEQVSFWSESQADRDACTARPNLAGTTGAAVSKSGAVNVADADGDGIPDLTFAGACKLYALKGGASLSELWSIETIDKSSAVTGSSVYDFNGDGKFEVLYNDELYFRILDGKTGQILYQMVNDTGTLYEYPVVVSLKAGAPASIVLSANSYSNYMSHASPDYEELSDQGQKVNLTGIRVIQSGDQSWMPTRTLWNQYLYTITNVLEGLRVPAALVDFISGSNRTRANIPVIEHPCVMAVDESVPAPTPALITSPI